jgi:hypothetical protein
MFKDIASPSDLSRDHIIKGVEPYAGIILRAFGATKLDR